VRLRRLGARALRSTVVPLLRQVRARRAAAILVYHDPAPETFERHVLALRRVYSIVPLRRLVEAHVSGSYASLPPKPLAITFDDGHRGNARLEPVLRRLGVPITIFLCSGIVGTNRGFWFLHVAASAEFKVLPDEERVDRLRAAGFDEEVSLPEPDALAAEDVQRLKPLVDFQAHTISHPILPRCAPEKARREIEGCKQELEQRFGLDVYALAYPNGDYSEREVELAREGGYEAAVSMEPGLNQPRVDRFRLRRIVVDDDADGVDEVLVKASGLWAVIRATARRRYLSP
jgi:peptidoglycan/xylan/chitin deacetylase (PgdA/CDA1 family)